MKADGILTIDTTFMTSLREATAELHSRLESLPISSSLVRPTLTIPEYLKYLSVMAGVINSVERDIFPMLSDHFPDISQRYKSDWIKSDLQNNNAINTILPFQFQARSVAFAFGILYVVEGSTLGGRYILNNVTTTLGLTSSHGARYFAGYLNESGAMWKKFVNTFTQYASANDQEEIIAGAVYAFESIYNNFETSCR